MRASFNLILFLILDNNRMDKFLYSKGSNPKLEKILFKKRVLLIGPAPYLEDPTYNLPKIIDDYDIIIRLKSGYPVPKELQENLGTRTDIYYTNLKENQNNLGQETFLQFYKDKVQAIVFPYPSNYSITLPISHGDRNLLEILKKNYQKNNLVLSRINNQIQRINPRESILEDNFLEIISDTNPLYFLNLTRIMKTRPTTGLLAILDILQYPIKELKIVGFTFRHHLIEIQKSGLIPSDDDLKESYSDYYKDQEARDRSWNKTILDSTHNLEKELNFFKILKSIDPRLKIDNILKAILDNS